MRHPVRDAKLGMQDKTSGHILENQFMSALYRRKLCFLFVFATVGLESLQTPFYVIMLKSDVQNVEIMNIFLSIFGNMQDRKRIYNRPGRLQMFRNSLRSANVFQGQDEL